MLCSLYNMDGDWVEFTDKTLYLRVFVGCYPHSTAGFAFQCGRVHKLKCTIYGVTEFNNPAYFVCLWVFGSNLVLSYDKDVSSPECNEAICAVHFLGDLIPHSKLVILIASNCKQIFALYSCNSSFSNFLILLVNILHQLIVVWIYPRP